jgi:hypothetical protein
LTKAGEAAILHGTRLSVAMSESERLGGKYIKLHRVSNIAQKCIELQIKIMTVRATIGSGDNESITV